ARSAMNCTNRSIVRTTVAPAAERGGAATPRGSRSVAITMSPRRSRVTRRRAPSPSRGASSASSIPSSPLPSRPANPSTGPPSRPAREDPPRLGQEPHPRHAERAHPRRRVGGKPALEPLELARRRELLLHLAHVHPQRRGRLARRVGDVHHLARVRHRRIHV